MSDVNEPTADRLRAFANIQSSINSSARLPLQVFHGPWARFFFFESDDIVFPRFIEIVQEFIVAENAKCVCLLNFDRTNVRDYDQAAIVCFDAESRGDEYKAFVRAGGPKKGWIYAMERYGCSSDAGEWCMYCERWNDVGVIGIRTLEGVKRLASPLNRLRAAAIQALAQPKSPIPIPYSQLTPEWRAGLLEHYGGSSKL